ncbi:exosome complex exonuclease Rrp41 [archaeon]|jgi:exosome complex component RRP41|nr:exosome complex exonuclease Rrp41 [archaeon]MBT4023125.1 exosome complex exonuclease Rrp41 [archaeon]MBT4271872.1 exosome complex exonuclease Rrp41 [archaeon]MBT4460760.1 exosome complex exonuclease Rrp41 [archaeon]MBT4858825.1 exosome complex exonuclease Rrp41 [archaeon]
MIKMAYKKRLDGRKFDELRPITAEVGVIPNAIGSAYFKIGKTGAYAAVYGPRDLYPRFLKNPKRGVLRCNYNMMPFSGAGDRVRPGTSRRSKEISLVTNQALLPVVNLDDFPNSVVDVFVELNETDAGSRCAGICAASMALADAGIEMKDLVGAISIGIVDGQVVLDLDYQEEAYKDGHVADVPMAYIPSMDKISLLQCDGRIKKDDLLKGLEMGKKAAKQLIEIQKKALKAKFEVPK